MTLFVLIRVCRAAKDCKGAPATISTLRTPTSDDSYEYGWKTDSSKASTPCTYGLCTEGLCCEADTNSCASGGQGWNKFIGSFQSSPPSCADVTKYWDPTATGGFTETACCKPREACSTSITCAAGTKLKTTLTDVYCMGACSLPGFDDDVTSPCCEDDPTKCRKFQEDGGCTGAKEDDETKHGVTGNTAAACCKDTSAPTPTPTLPPTPPPTTFPPTPPTPPATPTPTVAITCSTYTEPTPPPGTVVSAGRHCTSIGLMTLLVLALLGVH